jgi:ribonuclease-3
VAADRAALVRALGHRFAEPGRLDQALTHRSAGAPHNERLEFLGDALLNLFIADAVYARFPRATEGELSRLRATLVRRETLAQVARSLSLGEHLRLGSGELKSGGSRRDSILADALEAILGAVYLDGGLDACRSVVLRLFGGLLDQLAPGSDLKDPKTRLQEHLQSRRLDLPSYTLRSIRGEEHERTFEVVCRLEGLAPQGAGGSAQRAGGAPGWETVGVGSSRRRAEQAAARRALERLGLVG